MNDARSASEDEISCAMALQGALGDGARKFGAADIRKLVKNGYINDGDLQVATRDGLENCDLCPAHVDWITNRGATAGAHSPQKPRVLWVSPKKHAQNRPGQRARAVPKKVLVDPQGYVRYNDLAAALGFHWTSPRVIYLGDDLVVASRRGAEDILVHIDWELLNNMGCDINNPIELSSTGSWLSLVMEWQTWFLLVSGGALTQLIQGFMNRAMLRVF